MFVSSEKVAADIKTFGKLFRERLLKVAVVGVYYGDL